MNYTKLVDGMSGADFATAFNGNLDKTSNKFNSLDSDIALRVIANNVKQIKVDNSDLYFTLDGTNWVKSNKNDWGVS